jgi:DNA-binding XRE family transcriptional regulator
MKLQDEMIKKQKALSLTDEQMADKVGVHRVTYTNVKNGKRPMSSDFKVKLIRAFPTLQDVFLSENAT